MKRNLFAIFLAVMLVAALVFVAAPNAKATGPDYTFTEDGDSYTVNGDCIIDLAGFDVSINVSTDLEETPNVIVIDSKNLSDITGNFAGTLVVNGACNIDAVTFDGNFRYLKVENTDDDNNTTYSFYPFNLAITKQGVNVLQNSISLEVRVMANSVVRDMITGFGIYQEVNGVKKYSSAKETFDGKNGVIAYFDLVGSLTSANAEKVWTPYIQIGEGDNTAIIDGTPKTISRTNILAHINNEYAAGKYNGNTVELALDLYWNNENLRQHLKGLETTITTSNWELVTDVADLAAGDQVVIVAKDYNYAISTTQNNNNRAQAGVTKNGNAVTLGDNVQTLTLEAGTVSGTFAFNTGSGYLYAASSSKNYMRTETTKSANSSWTIEIADGTATIIAKGTNTRNTMQYNPSSSLFACYESASQKALAIYKLSETTTTTHTHYPATAATCTDAAICKYCSEPFGKALGHTGGTAACNKLAECDTCGKEYGSYADHVEDTPATCTAKATCAVCEQSYGNVDANNHKYEINGHTCDYGCDVTVGDCTDTTPADGICDYCDAEMEQGGSETPSEPELVEKTETMNIFANKGTLSNKVITWAGTDITFQNAQDKSSTAIRTSDSDHFRVYAKSKVTISTNNGQSISKVVITCTSSSYATAMKKGLDTAGYTVSVSGSTVTITVTGEVSTITFSATAQTRLKTIAVTYMAEA